MSKRMMTRARGAKTAALVGLAAVSKAENEPEIEEIMDVTPAEEEDLVEEETIVAKQSNPIIEKPKPVFATFKTTAKLEDGLSIIRSLGGGKFEVVNLKNVDAAAISSEETGAMIKNTPGLMEMIGVEDKDWEEARFKCGQAVSSANGTVFRFLKLPLELRYKIYDFTIATSKQIRLRQNSRSELNLALLQTCRQVHEEASRFFWRNHFRIDEVTPKLKTIRAAFTANVREVSFEWWGWYLKDPITLELLASCDNLKVLHVLVTRFVVGPNQRHRRQWLHQTNASIKKFSKLNGFDALCRFRGLDKVTVQATDTTDPHYDPLDVVSKEEIATFEAFLVLEVTQPKPKIQSKVAAFAKEDAKKDVKKGKGKRVKKQDIEMWP